MTEKKRFTVLGNSIKKNGILLNIEFKTKNDAVLCCKLLNQQDKDYDEIAERLDDVFKWHKEHYGKSVLDEKLEFKSDCEKNVIKLKNTLANRSEQVEYADYLIYDLGSEEMQRQWEEFNND